MKHLKTMVLSSLVAGSLALSVSSFSKEVVPLDLPPVQDQNGISFLSGGIGQPEISSMRHVAKDYDLTLTFADVGGHFLAGVKVIISDGYGNVVLDVSSNPILSTRLPSGVYKVVATICDETIAKKTPVIIGRPHQVIFTWPRSVCSETE